MYKIVMGTLLASSPLNGQGDGSVTSKSILGGEDVKWIGSGPVEGFK
jgi:hypothetical protein